jgi:hypothetical protein
LAENFAEYVSGCATTSAFVVKMQRIRALALQRTCTHKQDLRNAQTENSCAHHRLLVIAALRAAGNVCTNALLEATHARAMTAPVARMVRAIGEVAKSIAGSSRGQRETLTSFS